MLSNLVMYKTNTISILNDRYKILVKKEIQKKFNEAISTLRLNTLPYLHLAPINQIVSLGFHREI